jgi:hypothetical protein
MCKECAMNKTAQWSCPFCNTTGNTRWNKSAYYELEQHLLAHHKQQAYEAILECFDLKEYLITSPSIGWRFIGKHVRLV